MRRLAAFILLSTSCWAACAAHTYTVGTGKDYPGATGVADAIAAVKAACGYEVYFGGTQTISVYAAGGPYSAIPGDTYTLYSTATYPLIITAAPGESPVFNCGGSTAPLIELDSNYATFNGFEITACGGIYSGAPVTNVTISNNYIHDTVGSYWAINPNGSQTNWWVHHNRIVNVAGGGIGVQGNALIEYNEVGPTTAGALTQITCGNAGVSCTIRNNIAYGIGPTSNIMVNFLQYYAATVSGNVSYYNGVGFDASTTGSSSNLATFSHNIAAYSAHYVTNCEGGGGACWTNTDHALILKDEGSSGLSSVEYDSVSSVASTLSLTSSILWGDSTISPNTHLISVAALNSLYSDYNVFNKTGSFNTAQDTSGPTYYATLAAWQATGRDTHTVQTDPRFVGSISLLRTASQVFPECPTIECRLAKIRHNYTPTNLALKGTGCAWNGTTCVPDHSDIGPVPVTVYDAPGITGGGVY